MDMGVHSFTWQEMSQFIEDVNDFTDSIHEPRIPLKITYDCGYITEPLHKEDKDRFNSAAEYVIECLRKELMW